MDTDWCLSCDRHFCGDGPYCSPDCQDMAASSSSFPHFEHPATLSVTDEDDGEIIYHQVDAVFRSQWTGNGPAGILAWAADIPAATPAGLSPPTSPPSPKYAAPPPRPASGRPPKLLRSSKRPVPPTLCMSTPRPAPPSPSRPILTPQHCATLSISHSGDTDSMGKASLPSGATESSLATPTSTLPIPISASKGLSDRHSMVGAITSHVRSWASPSSPISSHLNLRISPAAVSRRLDPHGFSVVAQSHHSPALDISFSSRDSIDGDGAPVWRVSNSFAIDAPKATMKFFSEPPTDRRPPPGDHPSYRSRGRKLSRAVA